MSNKKSALITGANKGIGLEIARQLGRLEYRVWLGCRDEGRGARAAEGLRAEGLDAGELLLDVTDDDGVAAAAGRLEHLDVLVNNAGVSLGMAESVTRDSLEEMRQMFEVNALGPVRVTRAFLPLLRRSPAPRIVMMSSSLGSIGRTLDMGRGGWEAGYAGYSASKSALNMFTAKLAKELLGEPFKVNAACPGFTATDLNYHAGFRGVEEAARVAVALATLNALGPTGGFFDDGHTAELNRLPW
jgi:NAD(P)-dependent dehydrogenase (short-subunit alcohol dehydrogenase family)